MPSLWVIFIPKVVKMALTFSSGSAGPPAPAPVDAADSLSAPEAAGFAAILFAALLKLWHACRFVSVSPLQGCCHFLQRSLLLIPSSLYHNVSTLFDPISVVFLRPISVVLFRPISVVMSCSISVVLLCPISVVLLCPISVVLFCPIYVVLLCPIFVMRLRPISVVLFCSIFAVRLCPIYVVLFRSIFVVLICPISVVLFRSIFAMLVGIRSPEQCERWR